MTVEYRDGDAFTRADRAAIERVADGAERDVRKLLPALPERFDSPSRSVPRVIPETGETGEVGLPAAVYWTVNPQHPGGVLAVVNAQLRATLFHESYHLVREARLTSSSLSDRAVDEGLATAFSAGLRGSPTPWGAYPANVADWTREFLALPGDAPRDQWMGKHSDGRRWIGYRVGTYLADRAAAASGLTLAQLAAVPADRIIELALGRGTSSTAPDR